MLNQAAVLSTGQGAKLTATDPRPKRHPLSFFRPKGPFRGSLKKLSDFRPAFNRPVTMNDLGNISPTRLDAYDRINYQKEGNYWVSKHNPRFVLADLTKIKGSTIIAMLALNKCLVIRKQINPQKTISIYLTGPHTWAVWGWCEAAARGEILPQGNNLIHIDDHPDNAGKPEEFSGCALSIDNIDRVIAEEVQTKSIYNQDPEGISRFILPACKSGLIKDVYWEYSSSMTQESILAKEDRIQQRQRMIAERDRLIEKGDPAGVWTRRDVIEEWFNPQIEGIRTTMHSELTVFQDPSFENIPGKFIGYRSDNFPFSEQTLQHNNNILDIDIDVDDSVQGVINITRPHLEKNNWAKCITIAMSPEFGARDNHIEKVMGILRMLRR